MHRWWRSLCDAGGAVRLAPLPCPICLDWTRLVDGSGLCDPCCQEFLRPELSGRVLSLFRYSGPVRRWLLRVKISGDLAGLIRMIRVAVAHPDVREFCLPVQHVVPAPSSLSGRFVGQVDVAYFLARAVSTHFPATFMREPWSVRLNAVVDRGVVQRWVPVACRPGKNRVLIVDDVFTTGATLAKVANRLSNYDVQAMVLCRSRG